MFMKLSFINILSIFFNCRIQLFEIFKFEFWKLKKPFNTLQ